jgi:hypothetical protein
MFYKFLGNLEPTIVNQLESMIMTLHDSSKKGFQRIEFDNDIIDLLKNIFSDIPLQIQRNGPRLVQKAFYSDSGFTYPIHKDGVRCMSALNIAISSNENDWVRWYDDTIINNLGNTEELRGQGAVTRNTTIKNPETVEYIHEYIPKRGDVYVLDVNKFHTWHCGGPANRIVIQTKFDGFPDLETLFNKIKDCNFNHIIKE